MLAGAIINEGACQLCTEKTMSQFQNLKVFPSHKTMNTGAYHMENLFYF